MSFNLIPLIWNSRKGFFTSAEKAILIRMAGFALDDGSSVYPSLDRLSDDTEFSKKTVRRSITSLTEKGVLKKTKSYSRYENKANVYHINVAFLEELAIQAEGQGVQAEGQSDHLKVIYKSSINHKSNNIYSDAREEFPSEDFRSEKKSSSSSSKKSGTAFPENSVLTDEWKQIATDKGMHPDWVEDEFETFHHYYVETGKKWKRWDFTWRDWVKREIVKLPQKTKPKPTDQLKPSPPKEESELSKILNVIESRREKTFLEKLKEERDRFDPSVLDPIKPVEPYVHVPHPDDDDLIYLT